MVCDLIEMYKMLRDLYEIELPNSPVARSDIDFIGPAREVRDN